MKWPNLVGKHLANIPKKELINVSTFETVSRFNPL